MPTPSTPSRERVAVVGAGVAGLTAAYLLQRRYDVSLYEAEHRLGGHAHTHDVTTPDAGSLAVDTGFIVHNDRTYPLLRRLFAELDVSTRPTEMSMSVSCEGCGLAYAGGKGIAGILPSLETAARPSYLRMLVEVTRFHRQARALLAGDGDELTLRDFLEQGGYSRYFIRHFMVPVVACVWSTAPEGSLSYPARYLFAFLDNHGFLSVTGAPQWHSVVGGSRSYVERAAKGLTAVNAGVAVRAITRHDDGVQIRDDDDSVETFARVVVATHADTALSLLADPSPDEVSTLGAFGYTSNPTVLHTDDRLLPDRPRVRASWNYRMPGCAADSDAVLVSYDMNRLQGLATEVPHVVTLNDPGRIEPSSVIERMVYDHPSFTAESVAAQRELPALNVGRTAFAGAYHGWGFHEDGCRAGVAAAASFGVTWR